MEDLTNSPTPGFATMPTKPSWERKRKKTPLSAVVVISLLVGGVAGGAVGYVAADLANGVSNTTVQTTQVPTVNTNVPISPATETVSQIVQNVKSSVVSIKAEGSSGSGTGSGFIFRQDGYIVTNNHVVAPSLNGGKLFVYLEDKKEFEAKLVGRNPSYDLAVLKIDATGLTPVKIGDSNSLNVGDLNSINKCGFNLTPPPTKAPPMAAGPAKEPAMLPAVLKRFKPEIPPVLNDARAPTDPNTDEA